MSICKIVVFVILKTIESENPLIAIKLWNILWQEGFNLFRLVLTWRQCFDGTYAYWCVRYDENLGFAAFGISLCRVNKHNCGCYDNWTNFTPCVAFMSRWLKWLKGSRSRVSLECFGGWSTCWRFSGKDM